MADYNAADTRHIREAQRASKVLEAERQIVWTTLMSSPAGRAFVHDRLVRSHVFSSSFSVDPYRTAFTEGERNVGLTDLIEVMRYAPDQYIQMMREANDKEQADGRRRDPSTRNDPGPERSTPDTGGPDSGRVESDYDPLNVGQ